MSAVPTFGNLDIINLFAQSPSGDCTFDVDDDEVCLWDNVTGTIDANSPTCFIGYNYNNEGWKFAGIINEISPEFYKESRQATVIGNYIFTAICGTPADFCRTNNVEVDVIFCDDEGDEGCDYTCGWVGEQCDGTCPPTHPLCVDMWYEQNVLWMDGGYSFCACIDPDQEEVHPDWKPGGQCHDDSGPFGESPDCIDSDGNDIFTFGHVDDTVAMVSYPDECYDSDSVIEYVCNPLPSAMMPQDCPTTHKCEGGRCIEKTGYSVGDVVGGQSGTGEIPSGFHEASWCFNLDDVEVGGPCSLGARINTWWDYPPECENIDLTKAMLWEFYDSSGYVWGAVDATPPEPPRTNSVNLCPLVWDGIHDWRLELNKMYTIEHCDVDYEYDVEIYVCEC